MSRLRITATIAVILIIAAGLALYTTPGKWLIATWIEWRILQKDGLKIQIGEGEFGLLPPRLNAGDFKIFGGKENNQTFFQANAAEMQLSFSSLWSDDIHIAKIKLRSPAIFPDALPSLKEGRRRSKTLQIDQLIIDRWLFGPQTVISNIRGKWIHSSQEILLETLKGTSENATISIHGKWNLKEPKYDFSYEIQGDASMINSCNARIPPIAGPLLIMGRIAGAKTNHFHRGFWEGEKLRTGQKALSFLGGTYIIANPSEAPYQIEMTYRNLPYSFVRAAFPKAPQFQTNLSGNLRYNGGADFWESESTFWANLDDPTSDSTGLSGEVDGSIRNGKLFLDGIDLKSGTATVTFTGQIKRDSVHARVSALIPSTNDLKPYFPTLTGHAGSYVLEGRLEGAYKQMVLRGTLTTTNQNSLSGPAQISVPASFLSCNWLCNVTPIPDSRNQFEVAARSSGCF